MLFGWDIYDVAFSRRDFDPERGVRGLQNAASKNGTARFSEAFDGVSSSLKCKYYYFCFCTLV